MSGLDFFLAILGGLLALGALYLLAPAAVALFYRERTRGVSGETDVVVLVPAHDEEDTVAHCVQAFENQTYRRERFHVVVIADNCTDKTAAVAANAGAEVLVRNEPDSRGKGRALRWALDELLARDDRPGAFVVVDSDSTPDAGLLTGLVSRLEAGAQAVQGESLIVGDGSPAQELRAAAFLLVNRARPTGRAMLGLPANLAGNGMLFSTQLLAERPWSAYSSTEDVEYGLELRAAGIKPVFARGAIVWSPAAPHGRAAEAQQLRWEGGKLHLARTLVPRLLAKGQVDAAIELAIPPLGYLAAGAATVTAAGVVLAWLDVVDFWAVIPAAVALAAIPVYVVVGLVAAKAPRAAYVALAHAPGFVARKALRAHRLLRFKPDSWVRTERR
jgi:cellulose synthase/poly-beta-1,6-N-acetylglucosamine synthase-like glycosyltransferase